MIAQSGYGSAANFQVFARRVVLGYVRHSLVAHCLFNGALSCDGRKTRKLCTATSLCNLAPTLLCQTTSFSQSLAL